MRCSGQLAMSLALLLSVGCGDRPRADEPDPSNPPDGEDTLYDADDLAAAQPDSVRVYFTRDEETVEVRRPVAAGPADIRATFERLLEGPTPAEQAEGITSWFGAGTAGMLRSVTISENGSRAIIDFGDLRQAIPNASTSTGSMLLLQELNTTVFQFPELHSVEYRIDGSCDAFWEWLQYECHTVTRPVP